MSKAKGEKVLKIVDSGTVEECIEVLSDFNTENEKAREIEWLSGEQKERLWRFIFTRLNDPVMNSAIISPLLNSLRILSREKEALEKVMTDERVKCVMWCSGLGIENESQYKSIIGPTESLNGLKVIFNMIFQSELLQAMFVSNGLLPCLIKRVQPNEDSPLEVQYFLLKTFFIVTALCKGSGAIVRNDLNGIAVLIEYIDAMGKSEEPYDKVTADVISEALKVLYNIIYNIFSNKVELKAELYDSKDYNMLIQMCRIVRRNLLHETVPPEKKMEVESHSIHLLTAVPPECYDELLIDLEPEAAQDSKPSFEGKDMSAIDAMVNLLSIKLDSYDRGPAEPILLVLCKMASKNRYIRKFLKQRILPPLTKQDLLKRPEVGRTIRNKLCAVIHTPCGYATEVSANLLFVLCKENVRKLVKYTGYGNAAGLLANRGLMLGGRGEDGVYSDESDASENEEYTELRNEINDIEGWLKPEVPLVEMTDEQREVEALKLVTTIGKMTSGNMAIKPCRIGADGKPHAIGHVLELQEALESSLKTAAILAGSDTDSD